MERLTDKELFDALNEHEKDCCRCRERICTYESDRYNCLQDKDKKAYKELAEYRRLEEQVLESAGTDLASMVGEFMHYYNLKKENRLLELPCKVGEGYYYIDDGYVYKFRSDNIEIREEDGEFVYCMDGMDLRNSDFGKVAFLTEKEAVEKQIPKKPLYGTVSRDDAVHCPSCGEFVCFRGAKEYNYCSKCGQAIDWGEKE